MGSSFGTPPPPEPEIANGFVSAEQVTSGAATLTIAHGLGGVPKILKAHLVCKVAESGYSVGDEMETGDRGESGSLALGFAIKADATNVYVQCGTNVTYSHNNHTWGSGAGGAGISHSKWNLVVKAYL